MAYELDVLQFVFKQHSPLRLRGHVHALTLSSPVPLTNCRLCSQHGSRREQQKHLKLNIEWYFASIVRTIVACFIGAMNFTHSSADRDLNILSFQVVSTLKDSSRPRKLKPSLLKWNESTAPEYPNRIVRCRSSSLSIVHAV